MKPGDLIKVFRKGYQHWAIIDSIENKNVWCYHIIADRINNLSTSPSELPSSNNAQLKRDVLEKVAGKYRFTIDNQEAKAKRLLELNNQELPKFNIVRDILKGFEGRIVNYNVFDLNCEHFATFCKYGIGWSTQTEVARLSMVVAPGNMVLFEKPPVFGNIEDWMRSKNYLVKTLEVFLTGKN